MEKNSNAFDNLLASASWGTPESRQAFEELVAKEPFLKEAVMLRADYSRNLDEMKSKLAKAEAWDVWEQGDPDNGVPGNWDFDHNMTKAEYALQQRNLELQGRLEAAALGQGGEVTFDDLNKHLDTKIKALGIDPTKFVAKEDFKTAVDSKVEEGRNYNNYTANLATRATYCMMKHKDEFGEILDPNDLFNFAQEKGISDLDVAHGQMVADKRQAKVDARIAEEKKAEREAGRKEGLQERAMGESSMPTIDGSPDMGHLQKRLLSIGDKKDASAVDESVGLGPGQGRDRPR